MLRNVRCFVCSNRNILKRFQPAGLIRTVSSVHLNPNVHRVKPDHVKPKLPRWRGVVPEYVITRIRKEVLLTPEYRNRVVGVRKSWLAVSDSTSDILTRIRHAERSDVSLLTSLSHHDLIQLMSEVVNIPTSKISRHTLNVLEEECCCRINNFDAASLLFIADVFHLLKFSTSSSSTGSISTDTGSNHSTRYAKAMLKAFDYRWSDLVLSHRDVVLLSFHIGCARTSLLHLMHRIEEYMEAHAEQFSASELALVCHAFFINNTAFRRFTLLEKISTVVERDFALPEFNLRQLGSILKSLRHAHYAGSGFYEKLGNMLSNVEIINDSVGSVRKGQIARHVETNTKTLKKTITLNDLCNIAFAYASLKFVHPRLFQWISQVFTRSLSSWDKPRMKDFGRLLWSFSTLVQPAPVTLVSHLLGSLRTDPTVLYSYPEVFVEALMAITMSGTYPVDLIDHVFSNRFLAMKSLRVNEQTFQLMLLNSCARIECSHYAGKYPSPEYMRSVPAEQYGNIDLELNIRQGLRTFTDTIKQLCGSGGNSSKVRVHYILPHSRLADIEMRIDAKSNKWLSFDVNGNDWDSPLKTLNVDDSISVENINSTKTKKLNMAKMKNTSKISKDSASEDNLASDAMMSKSVSDSTERKISIKVMGRNQYTINDPTVLLGFPAMELRLLEKLGYDVYVVSPPIAQFLDDADEESRLKYVKVFLRNTCRISI